MVIILIPVYLDPYFLQFFVPLCVYLMETKGRVRCFRRWEDEEKARKSALFLSWVMGNDKLSSQNSILIPQNSNPYLISYSLFLS